MLSALKRVIIGCGGGFRHECSCKYGPMREWMSEVDLALQDEESAVLATWMRLLPLQGCHASVWLCGWVTIGKLQVGSVSRSLRDASGKSCSNDQLLFAATLLFSNQINSHK